MGSVALSTGMLVIRADAFFRIGTGHIMRCFALAQAWQLEGRQVVFLSHCESDALRQRITDAGMEYMPVAYPYPDASDLKKTLDILRTRSAEAREDHKSKIGNPMWLVLDGYHLDPVYQQAVRAAGFRLLVIDDMAQLPAYHADIILNQNLGAEKLKYSCNPDARLLLGPRYSLLRQEFLNWHGGRREIPKVATKVLVTMGGGDPDNVTLKVIHALQGIDIPDLDVKIVVGPSNPHIRELQAATSPQSARAIQNLKPKINILHHSPNMPELMAWADVAVTAGGSTCWESAFMGLSSVVLTLAENQKAITENLDAAGVAVNLGWHEQVSTADIAEAIYRLIQSPEIRNTMTCKGQAMVDGLGANRIVKEITAQALVLRRVTKSDCELLWEWANDPVARALSFSTEKIPWEKHVVWFTSKRTDPSTRFYMAVDKNDVPAGQIRYQINGQEAVVSVSLAPEQRGRGYGAEIIRIGAQELWTNTNVNIVHAYIKQDNIASIRAFVKAGFISAGIEEIHGCRALHYVLRKMQDHENSASN